MKIKLKKIGKWLVRRAKEKSTWIGAATLAVAVGKPELAGKIGEIGNIIAIVAGTGLIVHPSSESQGDA